MGCNWLSTFQTIPQFPSSPILILPHLSLFFLSQPPFSYIFPFLSLYSLMIILLVFIGYSLNRSSLMSFSLTFICQRVCIPPSCFQFPSLYPISTGFDFKALITRLAGTATNPNNILSSSFTVRVIQINHQQYFLLFVCSSLAVFFMHSDV